LTAKTSTRISTSTPERSDAAREAPPADLVERYDALRTLAEDRGELDKVMRDADLFGHGAMLVTAEGTKHVPLDQLQAPAKVSSSELASLAAKYVNLTPVEVMDNVGDPDTPGIAYIKALVTDVKRLAASVLSQA
jgi:hypothetical protein